MLVLDTSAFISLAAANVLETVLEEYDVYTTETVLTELEETAEYEDIHAEAAEKAVKNKSDFTVKNVNPGKFESLRVDLGEYSCIVLANKLDSNFILTDDFRALPELKSLAECQVAISPIILKALVKRDILNNQEAIQKLEELADKRNWMGAPIYRHAKKIF